MKKRGQLTIEYLLLLAAIILVALYAVNSRTNSLQGKIINVYNTSGDLMGRAVNLTPGNFTHVD